MYIVNLKIVIEVMKKTYIAPVMKSADLDMESLICESLNMEAEGFSLSGDDEENGSGLVKEKSLWDNIW